MESEEQLDRVVAPGEGESIEDRGQPGKEVIGQSAPVVSDEFGRLETGRQGWNRSGRGLTVGEGRG